jgi:hypothetical protein
VRVSIHPPAEHLLQEESLARAGLEKKNTKKTVRPPTTRRGGSSLPSTGGLTSVISGISASLSV